MTGRGTVKGFSKASRLRFLKFLARVDWNLLGPSTFVTLTYPDEKAFPDSHTRNKQRYLFWRYIENYLSVKIPMVWRIEWKARKTGKFVNKVVPHFHLILFGVRFISHQKINLFWKKAIQHEGYVRTEIKAIKNNEWAAWYVAKYVGKETPDCSLVYAAYLNSQGRHFGYLRKQLVPLVPMESFDQLTDDEIAFAAKFASEHLPWYPSGSDESFTLLGTLALDLRKYFCEIGLTGKQSPE
jgi:hypothetical protein